MEKLITWKSKYYQSTEHCEIRISDEIVIKSVITGNHDRIKYTANYTLRTSSDWHVKQFEISYSLNGVNNSVSGLHTADGWFIHGEQRSEFKNCIDIDITLTPFTNSLPINRLNLPVSIPQQIDVLYINVLENKIYPVRQQYTKKSETEYNFQNVPNDFEADIIVDNKGFVVHYPELFERGNN